VPRAATGLAYSEHCAWRCECAWAIPECVTVRPRHFPDPMLVFRIVGDIVFVWVADLVKKMGIQHNSGAKIHG